MKEKVKLTDASKMLPKDWSWQQAYSVTMLANLKPVNVILVPFSEAGQKGSEILTWIGSK